MHERRTPTRSTVAGVQFNTTSSRWCYLYTHYGGSIKKTIESNFGFNSTS
uniref:Uncharacterized protein n=1 Tax=Anguilla anguilla TaxID=7936 RepID=A0A0E9PS14_ANGAN